MGIIEAILHEATTKGREEGREEDIEKLLVYGLPSQEISKGLEVPLERVQQIAERLRKEGKLK